MSYLTRRLDDPEAAAEVAQESFVRAYFGLNKLKKGDAFLGWLLGIAQRVMLENFRRHGRERSLPSSADPAAPSTYPNNVDTADLAEAVAALPDIYRDVTVLRYFGGLSCAEVAERLGVPLGTVTKRLSRAYALLREALSDEQPIKVRT
jgi:RNA polymerase sigma-70 factor (ECF subfamily)